MTVPDRGRKIASPPDTLNIAVSLARIGWPVFPVTIYEDKAGKRHKVPAVKWKQEATTDLHTVAEWWAGEHSGRWIGVYAGAAGIVVLDVDPGGDDSIAEAGLPVPETFRYPTHRPGGMHYVYRAPEGVELTIAKGVLPGVDVRSGSGLMVYYGPELTAEPELAPAPDWILVERERPVFRGGVDAAPGATEEAFRERLDDSGPSAELAALVRDVAFPEGESHEPMLHVVAALVSEGAKGTPGIRRLLDETRDRYVAGGADRARDWENALVGSVRRFGLPLRTFPLTKSERKALTRRNDPDRIKREKAEHLAAYRIERHAAGMVAATADTATTTTANTTTADTATTMTDVIADDDAGATTDVVAQSTPAPGARVLEDSVLAPELAAQLRGSWSYAKGLGIMQWKPTGAGGGFWEPAEELNLVEEVRKKLVEIEIDEHTAAAMRGDNKGIDKARTLLSRNRTVNVARLILGILAEDSPVFDSHPDLLNTPNGVVDLRTGTLRPADPMLYFTRMTGAPYDPDADLGPWQRATEALPPSVVAWMKVRLGQAVTGYTPDDDVFVIMEGSGENGKTAWLIGVRKALGDYARTLPERLLVAEPGDHPTTLMTLMGARLGAIEELPEGRALNVKRLKDVVGTPEITARRMRQDDVTFPNTTSLFLATNYLPIVAETDHGTWRRLALVRFRETYLKRSDYDRLGEAGRLTEHHHLGDPMVKRHFEHNADPGLLRWLVEGATEWYALGMRMPEMPEIVERDTEAWRLDADPIMAYVSERIVQDENYAIAAKDLIEDFNMWLESRGHHRWTDQTVNSRFQGHVSMNGIERRTVKWSSRLLPSRPRSLFSTKGVAKTTTAWDGVRFVDESRMASEAESDVAIIRDLERRAAFDD